MGSISLSTDKVISNLQNEISGFLKESSSLEAAAQKFTYFMYENFRESIVLARVFATVPFLNLPDVNQEFVKKLIADKNVKISLDDHTPVLSLLGTSGIEYKWNNRRNSRDHVGVPLLSADFIDLIPMMSRLLKSLGVSLGWINSTDTEIIAKNIGRMAGLFYVPDAKTSVDEKGRKIITAQDFVSKYDVQTVFGFGGEYIVGQVFIVVIIFTREHLEKDKVKQFIPFTNAIKSVTTSLILNGKIFFEDKGNRFSY